MINLPSIKHTLAWCGFIVYELATVYTISHFFPSLPDLLLHYLLNIIIFYINASLFRLYAFRNKNVYLLLGGILGEFLLYVSLSYFINFSLESNGIKVSKPIEPLEMFLIPTIWRFIYFMIISLAYALVNEQIQASLRVIEIQKSHIELITKNHQLEQDVLASKSRFLRSQINPHLLFNTLNFIFNLVRGQSEKAGNAVMLLSEISRYSIQSANYTHFADLDDEVAQIQNLIELNQMRFNDRLTIVFECDDITGNYSLPSLILVTICENMFKYADLNNPENPASISIRTVRDELLFQTFNMKIKNQPALPSHKIGLQNIRERLRNLYNGDAFELLIEDKQDSFKLNLKIKLRNENQVYNN